MVGKSFKNLTRVVPKSVNRSMPFIKILIKSKGTVNKAELLRKFPDFVTNDIIESLYNVVMGNIAVQKTQVKQLKKYKKPLLHLINLPNKDKRKKFIYKQKGGFLGAVLPIIASLVSGIVANAV